MGDADTIVSAHLAIRCTSDGTAFGADCVDILDARTTKPKTPSIWQVLRLRKNGYGRRGFFFARWGGPGQRGEDKAVREESD